jgi:cob(I)alamin adenosyltransferase
MGTDNSMQNKSNIFSIENILSLPDKVKNRKLINNEKIEIFEKSCDESNDTASEDGNFDANSE